MQHDTVVDNGPGDVVLLDMQNVLQALATCMSGPVEPTTLKPGMFWLDTSIAPNGFLRQRNRDNTAWTTIAGVPRQATDDEVTAGIGSGYVTPLDVAHKQAAAMAIPRNRIVNPAMQISQENGDTASASSAYYPADQWLLVWQGGAHTLGRVSSITPRGSPKRLRWTVNTAKPALAVDDFAVFYQYLEGLRVADFGWGVASAASRRAIVRFGFRGPAGTYAAGLRNGGGGRTYVQSFTITPEQANLDTEQVFVVPGDTFVGAWPVDNTLGMVFHVALASGTNYQKPSNGWQASFTLNTAACSNGMDTVGNVFELFDVGLYLDLTGSGSPPRWQMPDEVAELRACQRYYVQSYMIWSNYCHSVVLTLYTMASLPVDMRTDTPTIATGTGINSQTANFGTTTTYAFHAPRCVRGGRACNTVVTNGALWQNTLAVSARM